MAVPQNEGETGKSAGTGPVRDYPLTITEEAGAVVVPATDHSRTSFSGGCVYDAVGALVEHSRRMVGQDRDRAPINPPTLTLTDEPKLVDGAHLYGGLMFVAFGHFLLEGTSRLWPLLDREVPPPRLAYAGYGTGVVHQLQEAKPDGYLRILLGAVGIAPGDVTLAAYAPMRFEQLTVPQSTISMQSHLHPDFPRFYRHALEHYGLSAPRPGAPRRIYFSRTMIGVKRRRAANEQEIERLAVEAGFEVVHPQRLPFLEQMALVRGADVIAGCDGSALHLSVFARPGTMVMSFDSRRSLTQKTIEAAFGLRGRRVPVKQADPDGDPASVKVGRRVEWTADLDRIAKAFATL